MADETLLFNGVNADDGSYLTAPMTLAELAAGIRAEAPDGGHLAELRRRHRDEQEQLGVMFGDPDDVGSAAWGLVTPPDLDPAVLEALAPLLALRREQAGDRFKQLPVEPGQSKELFLRRHGMGPSVADPRKVPYYLLLVGGPDRIPYSFQYQLDVSYAVGRLDFDTPEEYGAYADSVVAAETGAAAPAPRRAHLFGVRNAGDGPTALSASRLVAPLRDELRELSDWQVTDDIGEPASRSRLHDLVVGDDAPSVLFTASHGVGSAGDDQREIQGALLCQDWPGPLSRDRGVQAEQYLAGRDIPTDRPVRPRVIFAFACYSGGTPRVSDFAGPVETTRPVLAGRSFVARLPQRLLGNPAGGALAFVGHVDRAWSCSFLWQGADPQVASFTSALLALLGGSRLGNALEPLNARYAELSTEITARLDRARKYGRAVDDSDLVRLWTANNDARSYLLIGDPAVRIAGQP